jgi:hypothetical protein
MTKQNAKKSKMTVALTVTLCTIGLFGAGTASATHTHSMKTGNGSCVLLAPNGGEKDVILPHAEDPTKGHPLHLNVHLGEPGDHIDIGVAGKADSDPCYDGGLPIDYLND